MIPLVELTANQVEGINRAVIQRHNNWNPKAGEVHQLRDSNGLDSCISGIFYQSETGYMNLPIEKMAGLLLYRIAEKQFFLNGNKRTAFISAKFFLENNRLGFNPSEKDSKDLMWGFATPMTGMNPSPKYYESDAIDFVYNHVYPLQN